MRQLARRSLCTPELIAVWLLEALNYTVHVLIRPEPWNPASVAFGYALWALQLVCFAQLQLADAGGIPAGWDELAAAGVVPTSVCERTGRLVPPRARYCRRAGGVVLGLDHYCHWIGTPIGFGNRKLFVLFIGYSAFFCFVGGCRPMNIALHCRFPFNPTDALSPCMFVQAVGIPLTSSPTAHPRAWGWCHCPPPPGVPSQRPQRQGNFASSRVLCGNGLRSCLPRRRPVDTLRSTYPLCWPRACSTRSLRAYSG